MQIGKNVITVVKCIHAYTHPQKHGPAFKCAVYRMRLLLSHKKKPVLFISQRYKLKYVIFKTDP